MGDITIGTVGEVTLFVRDRNENGVYDEGDRIGVRNGSASPRFDQQSIREAYTRLGITGIDRSDSHRNTLISGLRYHIDLLQRTLQAAARGTREDIRTVRSNIATFRWQPRRSITLGNNSLQAIQWDAIYNCLNQDREHNRDILVQVRRLDLDQDPENRRRSCRLIMRYLMADKGSARQRELARRIETRATRSRGPMQPLPTRPPAASRRQAQPRELGRLDRAARGARIASSAIVNFLLSAQTYVREHTGI